MADKGMGMGMGMGIGMGITSSHGSAHYFGILIFQFRRHRKSHLTYLTYQQYPIHPANSSCRAQYDLDDVGTEIFLRIPNYVRYLSLLRMDV